MVSLVAGIKAITKKNYKSMVSGSKKTPVLVAFFMEGCEGCAKLKPVLARFAERWPGRVGYVEENFMKLEKDLDIQLFPAVVLYWQGKAIRKSDEVGTLRDLEAFTTI